MSKTLEQILQELGAYVDQDSSTPTGAELTTRVKLVDSALQEWGNAYQWETLRRSSAITFAFSGTSFALPTDFKKLMSVVQDRSQSVGNGEYKEIKPEDRFTKNTSDKYCYITGNDAIGRALNINPPLASGFSGYFDYQSFPSSMATLADISVCPHPEFITKRSIALVLESRSDARFPQVKGDAQLLLDRMIEEENTPSRGEDNRLPDWARTANFHIGED